MKRELRLRYLFILMALCLMNCKKDESHPLGPGIVLSVDCPPDTWYPLKDFLKENNVKLTFYIDGYYRLSDTVKMMMREMQADGHEMAHHSRTHPHSDEYVEKYGMDTYISKEIVSVTDSMIKDGFHPLNFAYPSGDCTTALDNKLLEHFNSLRKVIDTYMNKNLSDMDQLYFRYGKIKIFYGAGIDVRYKRPIQEVFDALEKAKDSRQTISLYCHSLSIDGQPFEPSNSHLILNDFKQIVFKAKKLNLKFYTVNEVSRHRYE